MQCVVPSLQINKVVLQKGWRCLDCTVCEGCGKPHDEGRLILCDECDISYHIYCLDPPLDAVPKGTWKCKWSVAIVGGVGEIVVRLRGRPIRSSRRKRVVNLHVGGDPDATFFMNKSDGGTTYRSE